MLKLAEIDTLVGHLTVEFPDVESHALLMAVVCAAEAVDDCCDRHPDCVLRLSRARLTSCAGSDLPTVR